MIYRVEQTNNTKRYRLTIDFLDSAGYDDEKELAESALEGVCEAVNDSGGYVLHAAVDSLDTLDVPSP